MKTNLVRMAVLAVAAVTMALPAFAGQTQGERERAPGSQVAPAKETGSFPADGAKQTESESVAMTELPTVEIGGRIYRIGIDTP